MYTLEPGSESWVNNKREKWVSIAHSHSFSVSLHSFPQLAFFSILFYLFARPETWNTWFVTYQCFMFARCMYVSGFRHLLLTSSRDEKITHIYTRQRRQRWEEAKLSPCANANIIMSTEREETTTVICHHRWHSKDY